MTKYTCTVCGKNQYTSDTNSKSPCIYCGGKVDTMGVAEWTWLTIMTRIYNLWKGIKGVIIVMNNRKQLLKLIDMQVNKRLKEIEEEKKHKDKDCIERTLNNIYNSTDEKLTRNYITLLAYYTRNIELPLINELFEQSRKGKIDNKTLKKSLEILFTFFNVKLYNNSVGGK